MVLGAARPRFLLLLTTGELTFRIAEVRVNRAVLVVQAVVRALMGEKGVFVDAEQVGRVGKRGSVTARDGRLHFHDERVEIVKAEHLLLFAG